VKDKIIVRNISPHFLSKIIMKKNAAKISRQT